MAIASAKNPSTRKFLPNLGIGRINNNELKPREIFVKYGSLDAIDNTIFNNTLNNSVIDDGANNNSSNNSQNASGYAYAHGTKIHNKDSEMELSNAIYKDLSYSQRAANVENPLWFLSEQIIKEKGQVLIFTTDRASTESIASKISYSLYNSKDFHTIYLFLILRK